MNNVSFHRYFSENTENRFHSAFFGNEKRKEIRIGSFSEREAVINVNYKL